MTSHIEWKEDYSIGNVMVDREHRELLALVNLIIDASVQTNGGRAVRDAFNALQRYVDKHFRNEEGLLEAVESHHFELQKNQHQMLRTELDALFSPEPGIRTVDSIHELAKWTEHRLLKHFLTDDYEAFHDSPFCE